jgi:hypothetical protein
MARSRIVTPTRHARGGEGRSPRSRRLLKAHAADHSCTWTVSEGQVARLVELVVLLLQLEELKRAGGNMH